MGDPKKADSGRPATFLSFYLSIFLLAALNLANTIFKKFYWTIASVAVLLIVTGVSPVIPKAIAILSDASRLKVWGYTILLVYGGQVMLELYRRWRDQEIELNKLRPKDKGPTFDMKGEEVAEYLVGLPGMSDAKKISDAVWNKAKKGIIHVEGRVEKSDRRCEISTVHLEGHAIYIEPFDRGAREKINLPQAGLTVSEVTRLPGAGGEYRTYIYLMFDRSEIESVWPKQV